MITREFVEDWLNNNTNSRWEVKPIAYYGEAFERGVSGGKDLYFITVMLARYGSTFPEGNFGSLDGVVLKMPNTPVEYSAIVDYVNLTAHCSVFGFECVRL